MNKVHIFCSQRVSLLNFASYKFPANKVMKLIDGGTVAYVSGYGSPIS